MTGLLDADRFKCCILECVQPCIIPINIFHFNQENFGPLNLPLPNKDIQINLPDKHACLVKHIALSSDIYTFPDEWASGMVPVNVGHKVSDSPPSRPRNVNYLFRFTT